MAPTRTADWPDSVRRPLDEAQRALLELKDLVGPYQRSFEQAIADHPLKAVLLSLTTGVFLGWLVKR